MNFDLDYDYLIELWNNQKGLCYYTGQLLSLSRERKNADGVSLDKLTPENGYIKGNVVWTTRLINLSKGNRNEIEFLEFCQTVTKYNESKCIDNIVKKC